MSALEKGWQGVRLQSSAVSPHDAEMEELFAPDARWSEACSDARFTAVDSAHFPWR